MKSTKAVGQSVSPAVAFLAETVSAITRVDANEDGKVAGLEILDMGQKLAFAAFRNFQGFRLDEFRAELKAVMADATARATLLEVFRQKFDLRNDMLEYLVEDTIEWLDRTVVLAGRWKAIVTPRQVEA